MSILDCLHALFDNISGALLGTLVLPCQAQWLISIEDLELVHLDKHILILNVAMEPASQPGI